MSDSSLPLGVRASAGLACVPFLEGVFNFEKVLIDRLRSCGGVGCLVVAIVLSLGLRAVMPWPLRLSAAYPMAPVP